MDYGEIARYRNNRSRFARKMGIWVEEIREGYAKAVKTIGEDDTNPVGRAHGAVLFALADTACGSAAVSRGYKCVTLNATYNFLRGGMVGDVITAEAREVKYGSTVSVYDVTLTDQNGTLVGSATMTFYCLKEPLDL